MRANILTHYAPLSVSEGVYTNSIKRVFTEPRLNKGKFFKKDNQYPAGTGQLLPLCLTYLGA